MYKFVVTYQAIIDGNDSEMGTIGSITSTSDYEPNEVKDTVIRYYKRKNPNSRVAVIIRGAKLVSDQDFEEAKKNFISLNKEG